MKAITFNGEVGSVSSKKDGSMGLRIATPEMNVLEKAAIMDLQGINVDVFIKPVDNCSPDPIAVDKDINSKSQSKRIRDVLFILWKQEGSPGDYEVYYKRKTDKYIDALKERIND